MREAGDKRPLLDIDHLGVAFGTGPAETFVVNDLSLRLEANRTIGLVGESGSGKSMSALAIMGLLPAGASTSGSIRFEETQVLGRTDREMRPLRGDRAAMIFQDPLSSLNPYYTVGLQIEETYRAHRRASRKEARKVALEALDRVHIANAAQRVDFYPHQFSGGMRQRVMIAIALCLEPALLIADEPTTALDVTVQAQILDLLHELQTSTGMAMLLISHDLAVVSEVADEIIVLKDGDTVESGTAERIFSAPISPYTQELLEAIPRIDDAVQVRERSPGGENNPVPTPLLEVRDLTKVYDVTNRGLVRQRKEQFVAVDSVSFQLAACETLAIVGESGSGKSTTARMVAKLLEPTSGTIRFGGRDVTRAAGAALEGFRKEVQVVFQDPFSSLNPRHTVEQIISAPARYQGVGGRRGRINDAKELMARVGLNPGHSDRYPWQFSGGQAQRIGIARALALSPKLVICDEAVSALDVSIQARVLALLDDLQHEFNLSYLFIAHDLAVVRQLADRVAVMSKGVVVEYGPRDDIFDHPRDDYTKTLLAAVPTIPSEWDLARRARGQQSGSQQSGSSSLVP